MKLSFYLLQESVENFRDAFLESKLIGDASYENVTPETSVVDFEYQIWIQSNKSKQPKWLSFINRYAAIPNSERLLNQVNSYVVIIKAGGRMFAATGGFGFNALNKDLVESNFGLITTLNSIDESKIKFFDVKNIDVNTKQKRVITTIAAEAQDFGLDFDQDLVRIVAGKPTDSNLGTRLQGSDSLSVFMDDFEFKDLGEKCEQLLAEYQKDKYKENFGFINHIVPIKSKAKTAELDEQLVAAINERQADKIAVTYPDQFDYEQCEQLKISFHRKHELFSEITLEQIYSFLGDARLTLEDLRENIRVIGFDGSGNPLTGSVALYDFFSFQSQISSDFFVLSNKHWYEVQGPYLERIDESLAQINYLENVLPEYVGGDEGDYNAAAAAEKHFILLDKDLFQIPGTKSKIEIGDMYDSDFNVLIHVKKDFASAGLSHLFSQGSVSADCMREYPEFRQAYMDKTGVSITSIDDLTVCFGIITKKPGNLLLSLPVFSKINLYKHYKIITKLGFKVQVVKISSAASTATEEPAIAPQLAEERGSLVSEADLA